MKPDSDNKSPGFWLYPADLERDLQILSLASQGLWVRMLCWMHANEQHRGFAELPSGQPMTRWDIASKAGKTIREVEKCLEEMARVGVYTTDARGCIYCRRMVRETHISSVRRNAANKRHSRETDEVCKVFAPAKHDAKEMQNASVTVSASVSVSDSSKHTAVCADQFAKWIEPWPRVANMDHAARCWLSVIVSEADEGLAFAARDRYLASDEVARGVVTDAARWLMDQKAAKWGGKWPQAITRHANGKASTTDRVLERMHQRIANGENPL